MERRTLIILVAALLVLFILIGILSNKKPKENSDDIVINSEQVEENPEQSAVAQELYQKAKKLKEEGNLAEAKEAYQKILSEYIDFDNVEMIQKELEDLNMKLIFSGAPAPQTIIHKVVSGDTLGELAKKYGTTIELIMLKNNLKNSIIRVGQQLRIWTGQFNVFVDKSQNILMLKQGDEVIKVYDVSTGENNSTPVGEFKVTSKLVDPVWFNRGVVVPPESPENVLGSRWLGFDIPGYGIHGTVEPETIGQQVTAGCVRMHNKDVEELYSILPLGVKVDIVD